MNTSGFHCQMPAEHKAGQVDPIGQYSQQTFQALIGICFVHCHQGSQPLRALPPFTEGKGVDHLPATQ